MAKMKELAMDVCEAYDSEGLTIMEIVERFELSEEMVFEILSNFSESFGVV